MPYSNFQLLGMMLASLIVVQGCSSMSRSGQDIGDTTHGMTRDIGVSSRDFVRDIGDLTHDVVHTSSREIRSVVIKPRSK